MSVPVKEIFSTQGQRQILEQLPQIAFLLDQETGECLFVNERFFEVLGYESRGQGHPPEMFHEYMHKADREKLPYPNDAVKVHLSNGGFDEIEYRFYHRDGHIVHLSGRVTRFTMPESNVACLLGNVMDITETRRNELENKVNQQVYEYAVQQSPLGVCVQDKDGYFLHVNPRLCEIFGYRYKELVGQHYTLLSPDESRKDIWNEVFGEILSGGGVYDGEWVMKGKDNELLTISSRSFHIEDNEGKRQVIHFMKPI